MATTITLDIHRLVKRLMASGIEEEQAEAIAAGLAEVELSGVATRQDVADLKLELAQLETRLTSRLGSYLGITVTVLSLIITLFKLF